jgi:hypothetical protein
VSDEAQTPQQISILVRPEDMGGVWANFARVSHTEHEFTIDFTRLDRTQNPVQGVVVARVNVSPLFITQLIDALQQNWEKYANKAMPKEVRDDDNDS